MTEPAARTDSALGPGARQAFLRARPPSTRLRTSRRGVQAGEAVRGVQGIAANPYGTLSPRGAVVARSPQATGPFVRPRIPGRTGESAVCPVPQAPARPGEQRPRPLQVSSASLHPHHISNATTSRESIRFRTRRRAGCTRAIVARLVLVSGLTGRLFDRENPTSGPSRHSPAASLPKPIFRACLAPTVEGDSAWPRVTCNFTLVLGWRI